MKIVMAGIERQRENVLSFILKLALLVVPQILGVVLLGWNWREMMVQFYFQLAFLFLIDIIVVLFKPRRLWDDTVSKRLFVSRLLFISILLLPIWGIMIDLMYGSNPYYTPRVEFFEQVLPSILMISAGYFVINLVVALVQNAGKKISEIDIGQRWMPMMFSLLYAVCFAGALRNNKVETLESILWVILLVLQVGTEVVYFRWRNKPKNKNARYFG